MKNRFTYILFTLAVIFFLPGLIQQAFSQTVVDRIQIKPGPEDMVLDSFSTNPRLLISCCGRREADKPYGEIVSLNLLSGKQAEMPRLQEPSDILFRPHGICLDGDLLYVISHEQEPAYHPVLVYRVAGPNLEFVERIHTGRQHSPNALITGPDGEIYLVNDSGKRGSMMEKALKLKRASVEKIQKDSAGTWTATTVAEKLGYPAGINRIGDRLYVGDAIQNRIHQYRISGDGLTADGEIRKLKGNDNIRVYQDQLLTPGHVKFLKFIGHAKNPEKKSPVDVFLVDPESGTYRTIYSTDGSTISAGSTAIIYNKHLYICQVFEPWILKVEL